MSELFIRHGSRDNAAARELQDRLEKQGQRSVFLGLDPEKGIQTDDDTSSASAISKMTRSV
jgi:hypothetical protein